MVYFLKQFWTLYIKKNLSFFSTYKKSNEGKHKIVKH
jgi:hypothetical protein